MITGSGFTGATEVKFGTIAATSFAVNSFTQISPVEPAGTVDVTVTTPIGTSVTSSVDQFVYEPAPTVTAISPTTGLTTGGTSVTITGTGLTAAKVVAEAQ